MMRLPWLNYYFLQCLFVAISLAESEKCNNAIYRQLQYCGDIEKYTRYSKDTQYYINFVSSGKFCYANSKLNKKNKGNVDWRTAQQRCKKEGGRLAEFHSDKDWQEFISDNYKSRFDVTDWYWLGGNEIAGKWFWVTDKARITKTHWAPDEPGNPNKKCLLIRDRQWHVGSCSSDYPYICQKFAKGAYEAVSEMTLIPAKQSGSLYATGETVQINCSSRTEGNSILRIQPKGSDGYSVGGASRKVVESIDGINAFDIDIGSIYFLWEKGRCFKYSRTSMKIKLNAKLHGATIKCTRLIERGVKIPDELDATDTLQLKLLPEPPFADLEGIGEGLLTPIFGDSLEYLCQALVGDGDTMTFALVQGNKVWAVALSKDGKENSVGRRPFWLNRLSFRNGTGQDVDTRIDYIYIYVSFNFTYLMQNMSFGCFSVDVTDKVKAGKALQRSDRLSVWTDFESPAFTKVRIYNLTQAQMDGQEEVSSPFKFWVSCTGFGVDHEFLSIRIKTREKKYNYGWKFPTPFDFPPWAFLKYAEEIFDRIHGYAFKLVLIVKVLPEMSDSTFGCVSTQNNHSKSIDEARIQLDVFGTSDGDDDGLDEGEDGIDDADKEEATYYSIWFALLVAAGFLCYSLRCCYSIEPEEDGNESMKGKEGAADKDSLGVTEIGTTSQFYRQHLESTILSGDEAKSQASHRTKMSGATVTTNEAATKITSITHPSAKGTVVNYGTKSTVI